MTACYGLTLALCAFFLCAAVAAKAPVVTLNHGGQLQGKTFDYNGTDVDLFLGKSYNGRTLEYLSYAGAVTLEEI